MNHASLILSDTHLSREHGRGTAAALAALVEEHRDAELVLAGDIFDLSLDHARIPAAEGVCAVLAAHPVLEGALARHVARGGRVTLVPGNHDAALNDRAAIESLRRAVGAPDERQLTVSSWFIRRSGVHVEHGHLYDPDNAPNHPLGGFDARTEPLGTALMRRFVAPNDAFDFAHAHETTPVSGLAAAFRTWGPKAPVVIVRYLTTALGLCAAAARPSFAYDKEQRLGTQRLAEHSAQTGLPEEVLADMLARAPRPTHRGFRDTVLRLYFDRIFAAAGAATGMGLLTSAGLGFAAGPTAPWAGALLTGVGTSYLAHNVLTQKSRYSGIIVDRIAESAHLVRETTGASLVVFGHTHVEADEPGYVNLGSFGFGPKRPHMLLDGSGRHELRRAA